MGELIEVDFVQARKERENPSYYKAETLSSMFMSGWMTYEEYQSELKKLYQIEERPNESTEIIDTGSSIVTVREWSSRSGNL